MPVLIETPRKKRFQTMEDAILNCGPVEKEALDCLMKSGTKGKAVKPKGKYKITSTGRHRQHVYSNLVDKEWAVRRYDNRLGGNVYSITPLGKQARLSAKVSKAPPRGYKKVRRGRPPTNGTGRRAAA